ncbi:MAG: hypothetical protein L3J92_07675 [Thermoplasmata archaeon]|jgi:hypothetical protein|nr:hypothetical protein [Thermoplasmata archaeon]
MEAKWNGLGLVVVLVLAFVLGLSGFAAASGSGYNQSYTQSAGHATDGAVDLVAASSTYTSGPSLTISFSVSGTINYNSAQQGYIVWFGGASYENATAYAVFANGSAIWISTTPTGEGTLSPQVSGSTLSFAMATADLPAPSSFTFNVLAYDGYTQSTGTYSWLGTNYNGGGTCTGTACSSTSGTSSSSFNWWIVIVPVIVIVVVLVVVLVLVMRRKPPTPTPMVGQPMSQPGWADPNQPSMGSPPGSSPPAPPGAQ